jgi:hypothetical protein
MLHFNTVNRDLNLALEILMAAPILNEFILVGGTALSLQIGHRLSVDIDMFSDASYGSLDFKSIDEFLDTSFPYTHHQSDLIPAMGKSYFVGQAKESAIKVDLFYTDKFIDEPLVKNNIRLATIDEIIAMKIDVVQRGARKKDFWDIHALLNKIDIAEMLLLHARRYPYSHNRDLIIKNITDFSLAEYDFNPVCLRGQHWVFVKEDILEAVNDFKNKNI